MFRPTDVASCLGVEVGVNVHIALVRAEIIDCKTIGALIHQQIGELSLKRIWDLSRPVWKLVNDIVGKFAADALEWVVGLHV